jgi:simple sugar transport system permease protein
LGINVRKIRYSCVAFSGVLAGFGGACMSLFITSHFSQTSISGQGFIALAAVIFGKWSPFGVLAACLLFGFAQELTVILGGDTFAVPSEILSMTPYILTIIVLIFFVGKSAAPKADGQPFEEGR